MFSLTVFSLNTVFYQQLKITTITYQFYALTFLTTTGVSLTRTIGESTSLAFGGGN